MNDTLYKNLYGETPKEYYRDMSRLFSYEINRDAESEQAIRQWYQDNAGRQWRYHLGWDVIEYARFMRIPEKYIKQVEGRRYRQVAKKAKRYQECLQDLGLQG